mgnify:CR=1 FL=1
MADATTAIYATQPDHSVRFSIFTAPRALVFTTRITTAVMVASRHTKYSVRDERRRTP